MCEVRIGCDGKLECSAEPILSDEIVGVLGVKGLLILLLELGFLPCTPANRGRGRIPFMSEPGMGDPV